MYTVKHNALIVTREECSQLFLIFTGIVGLLPQHPMELLKTAGLEKRNVIILSDPARSGYLRGCSAGLRGFDALMGWLQEVREGLPHVRTIYSIGVSAGALAAMLAVNRLRGECSWIFGPRLHSLRMLGGTEEVRASGTPVTLGIADRLRLRSQALGQALRRRLGIAAFEPLPPEPMRAAGYADFAPMVEAIQRSQGAAVHHLYCVRTNPIDAANVEHLARHCPRVRANAVEVPPGYPRLRKQSVGWDHEVFQLLSAAGRAASLFPAFAPAAFPSFRAAVPTKAQLQLVGR